MVDADLPPVSDITIERAEIFRAAAQVIAGEGAGAEDTAAAITDAAIKLDARIGLPPRDNVAAVALAGYMAGFSAAQSERLVTPSRTPRPKSAPVKRTPMKASPRKEGDRR